MCKWIEKGRSLCRRKCLVFWEKERLCSLLSCALSTRHRLRPDYKVIKRSGEIPVMQCRSAFAAALAGIPHNLYNYAVSPLTKGWNRGLFLFVRVRLFLSFSGVLLYFFLLLTSLRWGRARGRHGSDASADCDPKQYACSECSHDPRTEP